MIPESSLRKILVDGLEEVFPLPEGTPDDWKPSVANQLAHFVTKKSYDVMKEEKAPQAALLQAACIVLTRHVLNGHHFDGCDLTIGRSLHEGFLVVQDENAAVAGKTLAEALIQFAENTE